MPKDLIDFDKAWAEHGLSRAEPEALPDVKMFGETFPRRRSLPAAVTLLAGRLQLAVGEQQADGAADGIGLEDLIDVLKLVVPIEVLDRWVYVHGLDEPDLRRAFLALYSLYNGVTPDGGEDGDEGEAQAPASSKPRSKAGASSKRTSKGSTARTSTG